MLELNSRHICYRVKCSYLKAVSHSAKISDQTFLIGNFCSDFLVHFPFGAQIVFSFEVFSCFSKVQLIMEGLNLSTIKIVRILIF